MRLVGALCAVVMGASAWRLQFVMIGSGNPAEGELRPQLLDRFGLSVDVSTLQDMEQRVQLVLDRMAYEQAALPPPPL